MSICDYLPIKDLYLDHKSTHTTVGRRPLGYIHNTSKDKIGQRRKAQIVKNVSFGEKGKGLES